MRVTSFFEGFHLWNCCLRDWRLWEPWACNHFGKTLWTFRKSIEEAWEGRGKKGEGKEREGERGRGKRRRDTSSNSIHTSSSPATYNLTIWNHSILTNPVPRTLEPMEWIWAMAIRQEPRWDRRVGVRRGRNEVTPRYILSHENFVRSRNFVTWIGLF